MHYRYNRMNENNDLDVCKKILSRCTSDQLKDLVNKIVDDANEEKFSNVAHNIIYNDLKIKKQFRSIFNENNIDIDVVNGPNQPWPDLGVIVDSEDVYDDLFNHGIVLNKFIKKNSKCIVKIYKDEGSFIDICLDDIDVEIIWQKVNGLSDLDFACKLLENIVVNEEISIRELINDDAYTYASYQSLNRTNPNDLAVIITRFVIDHFCGKTLLNDLITLTPKALRCLCNFCECTRSL